MTFTFEDCQKATVRIYNSDSGTVCGAGFLVHGQYVMTCAHVVNDALGVDIDSCDFPITKIELDFPKFSEMGKTRGKVIVWQSPSGYNPSTSDIALLRLDKSVNIKPITLKNPLEISKQKSVSEDSFKIWGFPSEYDQGLATEGKFVTEEQLRIDVNMPRIIGGFSGSPVWDIATHNVVGMVVETDTRDQTTVDDYGSGYDAEGFDGGTAFARRLSILADVWYKQGEFSELARQYRLWEEYRDILLEAYDDLPEAILDNEPDSVDSLLARIAISSTNLLHWTLSLYVFIDAPARKKMKKSLIECLKNIYSIEELKEKYNKLKEIKEKGKIEETSDVIDARLWLFFNALENSDHLQLSSACVLKNDDLRRLEQINVEFTSRFDRTNIVQEISSLLKKVLSQAKKYGKVLIEIFLPYEWLDLTPDAWILKDKFGQVTLGASHPVVIRVLDRVLEDDEYTAEWRNWQKQWDSHKLGISCRQSLMCCDRPGNELDRAFDLKKIMGLSIKSPPENHRNEPLPMIMRKGVAIAFWLRKKLEDCQAHEEYQKILSQTHLRDLPQELKFMRNADPKNPDHLARHLTLLWDDPTVAPPADFDFSFVDNVQKL